MKKNKMMRLASVLLVAVMLTMSIISGTYAKYVTRGEVVDSARVAEFGVVVAATGNLFSETYYSIANNVSLEDENMPGGNELDENLGDDIALLSVESWNAADKVVAPGTRNTDGVTFAITGQPEVDVRISAIITDLEDVYLGGATLPDMTTGKDEYFSFGYDYYPIVYTLTAETFLTEDNFDEDALVAAGNVQYATPVEVDLTAGTVKGNLLQIAQVLEYIFDMDNGGYYVDANTDLANTIGNLNLAWEWKFEDLDDEGNVIELQDQQDTLLGDLISLKLGYLKTDNIPEAKLEALNDLYNDGEGDFNLTTSINLTITVTQVD